MCLKQGQLRSSFKSVKQFNCVLIIIVFKDERAFSEDEEEKLQIALGLESDDLHIVLETCAFILEQVSNILFGDSLIGCSSDLSDKYSQASLSDHPLKATTSNKQLLLKNAKVLSVK